jgi:hypothetical protein
MTIDDRITRAAEDVQRSLVATPVPPFEEVVGSTRRGRPGWQLAVAAAAVALVVAGVPFLIGTFGESTDDVAGNRQETTIPTADPTLPDDPFTLVAVPPSDDLTMVQMGSVAVTDSGFVAGGLSYVMGTRDGDWEAIDTKPSVWLSSDGTTWDRVGSPVFDTPERAPGADDTFVVDVAFGPLGYVAVGGEGVRYSPYYDAVAWHSQNGRDWVRAASIEGGSGEGRQTMTDVVAGGPGWVAAGDARGEKGEQAGIWVSSDGITWSAVDLPHPDPIDLSSAAVQALDSNFDIQGLVVGDGVLIAVGNTPSVDARSSRGSPDPFDFMPLAWRSTDGVTWELIVLPVGPAPLSDIGVVMDSVTALPDGTFVALGHTIMRGEDYFERVRGLGVWTSPDGIEWRFTAAGVAGITDTPATWLGDMYQPIGAHLVADARRLLIVGECFEEMDGYPEDRPPTGVCVLASTDLGESWRTVSTIDSDEWNAASGGLGHSMLSAPLASEFTSYMDGTLGPDGSLVVVGNSNVWTEG